MWDEILRDSVLGKYAPNPVITRGIIDIIQRLEDKFLAEVILEFVRNYNLKDRACKVEAVKQWMASLHKEINKKDHNSADEREEADIGAREAQRMIIIHAEVVNTRTKIDFKLKSYDGTTDTCAIWFWKIEKTMKKLRISESDYLLHAINSTTDKANYNQIINVLDNAYEFENDYVSIKDRMITMFDIKSKQEILSEYNRSFKQTNTESMTDYYIWMF